MLENSSQKNFMDKLVILVISLIYLARMDLFLLICIIILLLILSLYIAIRKEQKQSI